jgi:cell shape-determining protein MreC
MENLSLYADRDQKNELLELLGQRELDNLVLASVLVRPPRSPYDVIIIDAGSENGISIGSKVYLEEGPILGTVSEVFSRQARVNLFSSNAEEVSGVMERDGLPVTLIGSGGGNFKVSIPRDASVEKGDRILSAETASSILAVVGDISLNSTDSFKDVLAKSPANIFNLRFVLVKP